MKHIPREEYVLSTKVGRYGADKFGFSSATVTKSLDESMERLNVEHVDIVFCHDIEFVDLDIVVDQAIPTLLKMKESGKIKAIGISGYPLEVFPYIVARVPPGTINVVLSYCNYTLQNQRLIGLLPYFQRESIGVINGSPLCMGLLTDSGGPDWHPASPKTKGKVREAATICKDAGTDLSSVALQYAMGLDGVASTLVGIDSTNILKKNIDTITSKRNVGVERKVLDLLKPMRNQTWNSGRFTGIS